MKNNYRNILVALGALIALAVTTIHVNAQNFRGIATYKSDRDMSQFQFHADGMSPDQMEKMKAQMKKQFQKEYELKFNLTESSWEEAESLDAGPVKASAGGMQMEISMGGGLLYKNTSEKKSIQQTESFSKLWIISDQLESRDWKMTGKTKKIGDYTADQAIYENIREMQSFSMSDEGKKTETIQDTVQVTVWYTPDIPVPHGPEDYWGLPGLILELNDGRVSYLCTKIELNPDKAVEIKKPKKGKKVTADEFEKISDEMAQKMMKKYQGQGDGERVMIMRSGN